MQFDFDFIGIQNYFSVTVKNNSLIPYIQASEVTAKARKVPHTALGWEINADSFYRMLKRYWNYGSVNVCYRCVLNELKSKRHGSISARNNKNTFGGFCFVLDEVNC